MLDSPLTYENKRDAEPKIIRMSLLTSTDIEAHNPLASMENVTKLGRPPQGGRQKQVIAYPLRFRSQAQKKRLEEAAKRSHKTMRDFLLDLGERAASGAIEIAS